MKLAILADELSPVPSLACELAALYGVRYVELRNWYRHRAPEGMSETEMRRVRTVAEEWGLQWSSVSPGLFKVAPEAPERDYHAGELFDRSLDLCEALGARLLVSFTPLVPPERLGKWDPRLVEDLRGMGERAAARGIILAVENESACVAGSAAQVARLLGQVGHPAVRMNWDPGNDAHAGYESGPQVWPQVAPHLAHVHVKDYRRMEGRAHVCGLGEGGADWRGVLSLLREARYEGMLVIEPHDRPQAVSTPSAILAARRLLAEMTIPWA